VRNLAYSSKYATSASRLQKTFQSHFEGMKAKNEYLVLFLRRACTMSKFGYMICASFVRCKIPYSVWITRIHEIIFSYKIKQAMQNK
jgi:hypothetical protein